MKKNIVKIMIFFLFIGCQENSQIEDKIASSINENCKKEECEIDLSKITPFKWNKLYVFKETASLEIIEKVLNQEYSYSTDIARRLIFVDDNNRIIYHEDIFPNVEGVTHGQVIFSIPDTISYKIFSNSLFSITKEKINNGEYYILKQ